MKNKLFLRIGWIYPEFMNIYGDRGNITVLRNRSVWRGIRVEVKKLELGFKISDMTSCDIIMMGGAQDIQQQIVESDLLSKREELKRLVEEGISGLFVCGAYQSLGKYYKDADGNAIEGLDILDLHTVNPGESTKRLIGNITARAAIKLGSSLTTLVGFENHGGRTYLGKNLKPLAKVLVGNGNNGEDGTEGAVYKNIVGTYMHGPILPKNPHLADYMILNALRKKYGTQSLTELQSSIEIKAHSVIAKRMGIEI